MKITDVILENHFRSSVNHVVLDDGEAESIRSSAAYRFFIAKEGSSIPLGTTLLLFAWILFFTAASLIIYWPLALANIACFIFIYIGYCLVGLEPLEHASQIDELHQIARDTPDVAKWLLESNKRNCSLRYRDLRSAKISHEKIKPTLAIKRKHFEAKTRRDEMMADLTTLSNSQSQQSLDCH